MRADRRTSILKAAARVIARRGVRGLRVSEIATEAGVSTALVYYHFKDRAGILRLTMEFISDRAERYTAGPGGSGSGGSSPDPGPDPGLAARQELERSLLLEFQDRPEVRENSTAWGELRATAVFDPELREALAEARLVWIGELTDTLGRIHRTAPGTALTASAERLTAALEGLSMRWLSEVLSLAHARELMSEAIAVELAYLRSAAPTFD
ncbi:TetR/AcrR family transcriptional regulator [Streptomyces sp. NPDC057302]|uniref:TetR/AcrR family transcriptional regulator n=1 Tax=Streptomyces sp. NPDC057302 TaxID=3346094 RepID=UPI00362FF563